MYNRKRVGLVLASVLLLSLGSAWLVLKHQSSSPSLPDSTTLSKQPTAAKPVFDRDVYSLDSPASPWVIVNKRRPLQPIDFAPPLAAPNVALRLPAANPEMQLSNQITPAVEQLFAAAKQVGLDLMLASGYRSYQQQVTVYDAEVNHNGRQSADRESARPGHSEHQTGLALDIEPANRQCEVQACFAATAEGKWLATNAYRYGFIIRYSQGNEALTGYTYEPWHIRYVGNQLAAELHKQSDPTLEIFFGLGAAADYQ